MGWFILWVVFAFAVLMFIGWSVNVAMSQRNAWREFATKYKLDAQRRTGVLLGGVFVTGTLQGRKLNIYSQPETSDNKRMNNAYTHIEVFLNNLPPALLVLSKKLLPDSLSDLQLPQTVPAEELKLTVAQSDDPQAIKTWMTSRRMMAIKMFMDSAGEGDQPMLVCDGDQAYMLWRTDDPLRDPRALNAQIQKLFAWAKEIDA